MHPVSNKIKSLTILKTNKDTVSYSELSVWSVCAFKHKLKYIDNIDLQPPTEHLFFGKAIHATCQEFLSTKIMNMDFAAQQIVEYWQIYKFSDLKKWLNEAVSILKEIPDFIEQTFKDWEYINAEEKLVENINGLDFIKFKGYIDGIIKTRDKKGKEIYYIFDWKTSSWGWGREKKQDNNIKDQLVYYKNFWSVKHNIPLKQIRCAFIILKRTAKPGKKCELFPISAGPVVSERAQNKILNMVTAMENGLYLKNKFGCKWCPYEHTVYCP